MNMYTYSNKFRQFFISSADKQEKMVKTGFFEKSPPSTPKRPAFSLSPTNRNNNNQSTSTDDTESTFSTANTSFGMSSQHVSNYTLFSNYAHNMLDIKSNSPSSTKLSRFAQLGKTRRPNVSDKNDMSVQENEEDQQEDDELLLGFDPDRLNREKKQLQEEHKQENETKRKKQSKKSNDELTPSIEPYLGRLEKFELFTTYQAYYLVGCDKHKQSYRVLRMDRTLIEHPSKKRSSNTHKNHQTNEINRNNTIDSESVMEGRNTNLVEMQDLNSSQSQIDVQKERNVSNHNLLNVKSSTIGTYPNPPPPPPPPNPPRNKNNHQSTNSSSSFRRLPDFCIEDPYIYTEDEIQEVLDMIHDGNKSVGGLRPVVKAYGIVGFITFLDCYYLTLITKRTKVGEIGTNGIYSIKVSQRNKNI